MLTNLRLRLGAILRRHKAERELDDELRFHVERQIEKYVASGLSREEAVRRAGVEFGGIEQAKEDYRDARDGSLVEAIGQQAQEIRQATRRLLRAPAFTAASVLTLALAIGSNASIFAVVHRVVLNPLPYPDSDRLIELDQSGPGAHIPSGIGMTWGVYYQYQDRARTLDSVALYTTAERTLTGRGEPERIRITRATPTLAAVLRVPPALGRWFTDREGVPGTPPTALLSHGLWTRRYGGDPRILGQSVVLNGIPTQIVGVMPAAFAFPDPPIDMWVVEQNARTMIFDEFVYNGVARLRDGATVENARAELTGLIADLATAYPDDGDVRRLVTTVKLTSAARTLKDATIGGVARALWILLASVAVVLLVACANVANLFLVRSEARHREVSVRYALGAGRVGIARYFLTESGLLSLAGGLLGVGLAWAAVRVLVRMGPATLPRLHEVRIDGVIGGFTFVLSVLAALAFGTIPMLRRTTWAVSLHERGRSNTVSRGSGRVRHILMGTQVGLALVLLVSSALMVRSFQTLRAVDPGFNSASTLTFRVGLPEREYPNRRAAVATHHAILDRLSALPGVTRVSASTCLPLQGNCFSSALRVEGRPPAEGAVPPLVRFRAVAAAYFETIGTKMVRGRGIDRVDVERGDAIAVVNQALATVFFPGVDPIGQRVVRGTNVVNAKWLTIVGVVADTPVAALGEPAPAPQLYAPMSTDRACPTCPTIGPNVQTMSYVIRSATPPLGLLPAIRGVVAGVDRNLPLAQVRTLQDILDRASAQMAFTMVLIAMAAGVALMLGVVGIYGVMSYVVSQRTSEIGVRLALGAAPSTVAGMIVRQGGLVALAGIAIGLGAALAGSRLLESLLYGISPRDPGVFAGTTVVLLAIALVACWLPARRAARLSPVEALKSE